MNNTTAARGAAAADECVMRMLQQHVPLALLADLVDPLGPESETPGGNLGAEPAPHCRGPVLGLSEGAGKVSSRSTTRR